MDPYVATIVKECAAIAGAFLAAGLLVAFVYGLVQHSKLQHAMTLNMVPPQLP
jgi:hypothetical protein